MSCVPWLRAALPCAIPCWMAACCAAAALCCAPVPNGARRLSRNPMSCQPYLYSIARAIELPDLDACRCRRPVIGRIDQPGLAGGKAPDEFIERHHVLRKGLDWPPCLFIDPGKRNRRLRADKLSHQYSRISLDWVADKNAQ